MKTPFGYIQGYNAQAVANENQIVLAAEVTSKQNDYDQLHPMIDAMQENLEAAGVERKVDTLVADSGYLSDENLLVTDEGPELLIAAINDRNQRIEKKVARGASRRTCHPRNGWHASSRPDEVSTSTETRSDHRTGFRAPKDQRHRAIYAARTDRVRQRVEAREHDPQPPQAVAFGGGWTIRSNCDVAPSPSAALAQRRLLAEPSDRSPAGVLANRL